MGDWAQLISSVGFPIVSFLLCGFALKYVYDKERSSLDQTIDKLSGLTLAVEKNSEAIRDLAKEISRKED